MPCPHTYFISYEELIGKIQATGGSKQGSKDNPFFLNLSMYLILNDLLARYNKSWIVDHITVFVHDLGLRWIVHSI